MTPDATDLVLQNMRAVKEDGECCSKCVTTKGMCTDGGEVHYNGQLWRRNECEYCVCRNGRTECSEVQCNISQCAQVNN